MEPMRSDEKVCVIDDIQITGRVVKDTIENYVKEYSSRYDADGMIYGSVLTVRCAASSVGEVERTVLNGRILQVFFPLSTGINGKACAHIKEGDEVCVDGSLFRKKSLPANKTRRVYWIVAYRCKNLDKNEVVYDYVKGRPS